jgi:hypothetical protein
LNRYFPHVPAEFPNGSRWSDEDVEKMLRLIEGGSSLHDLMRFLGRTEAELTQEAFFLGVMLPQHGAMSVSTTTADSSAASATIHYAPFGQAPRRTAT